MEIGKKLTARDRKQWRAWLVQHAHTEKEIWLVYFNKHSAKKSISYDAAVEEALCFGWIDSTVKKINDESRAQRFTPRRKKSEFSELNKVRVEKMIKQKKMTKQGLESLKHVKKSPEIGEDIYLALKKDVCVWKHFSGFSEDYKRIRLAWIESARSQPEEFTKRLSYFVKKTRQGKMYGTIP